MLRAIMLIATLLVAGCDLPLYQAENEPFPAMDPALPAGYTETFYKVRGYHAPRPPALRAEAGDVWPGPPGAVPTSLDIMKQQDHAGRPPVQAVDARPRRGGYGMCRPGGAPATAAPASPTPRHVPPGVALGLCFAQAGHPASL
jgi:hypothetical protein